MAYTGASPWVTVADTAVNEGASGTSSATLTLTLSAPVVAAATVNWTTAAGSAVVGADFVAASGTATFAAGSQSATVTVSVVADATPEVDETFKVLLSNPVGISFGDNAAVITIVNDDVGSPTLTIATTDASGAEQAGDPIVFTVTRSGNFTGSTVVNLAWSGTATLTTDYTVVAAGGTLAANKLTLTLAAGVTSATLTLSPVNDVIAEGIEGVTLTLTGGTGYTVGASAVANGTIADNDVATLAVSNASVTEGNSGTKTVAVTVTLSVVSATPVTVSYATVNGTAIAGSDYQSTSGTMSFAAGVTSKTFNVTINGDTVKEPGNETFQVMLSNPVGAMIGVGSATITIVDDERALTAPAVSSAPVVDAPLKLLTAGPVIETAIDLWEQAGVEGGALRQAVFEIIDLPGEMLALTVGSTIFLDVNAAGHGWFVDSTPADDSEFGMNAVKELRLAAKEDSVLGRMDLLTVVSHEIGHLFGLDHNDSAAEDLMDETLDTGTRLLPQVNGPSENDRGRMSHGGGHH